MSWLTAALDVARKRYDRSSRYHTNDYWTFTAAEAASAKERLQNLGRCIATAAAFIEIHRRAVRDAKNGRRP